MIIFELKAIGINFLFGIFFYIIVNTFSLYESRVKSKILINFFYFFITISIGVIYILYIDSIFISFNFYYILFIVLGFYIASSTKPFKTEKYILIFEYFIKTIVTIIKKVFLFLINYSFWSKIKPKRKTISKNTDIK